MSGLFSEHSLQHISCSAIKFDTNCISVSLTSTFLFGSLNSSYHCSPDISGDFWGFRVKLFINDQNSFGVSLEVCNLFLISKPYEHFVSLHRFLKLFLVFLYSSKDSLLFVVYNVLIF